MTQAKAGDTVRVHYTGTLQDGTQFDSSTGRDPLEFTLGSGQIIPGLDNEVTGMAVGDTKQVTIAPSRPMAHAIPTACRPCRANRSLKTSRPNPARSCRCRPRRARRFRWSWPR